MVSAVKVVHVSSEFLPVNFDIELDRHLGVL